MKIIKKEQEKSEDAEIQKNDSVQGKENQVEKTPQGQRSRNRPAERVPAPAAKSLKPKEPAELREGKSKPKSKTVNTEVKNSDKKKGKGFLDFVNSLLDLGF